MMIVIQNIEAQGNFLRPDGSKRHSRVPSASNFAHLYVGVLEPQYQMSLWHDSPYYKENTNTYEGRVSYCGVVYDHVQLRFDQWKQRVVVLSPVGNVFCVPDQRYIDWFEMDGHRYEHDLEDSTRYAYLLCDGRTNGIRLYHCIWKNYTGERIFEREINQKTLSTEGHYTLVTPDGACHHVKRASHVAKLFPEQEKQIKQVVARNRLSFSKRDREQSLVKVVETLTGSLSQGDRYVTASVIQQGLLRVFLLLTVIL